MESLKDLKQIKFERLSWYMDGAEDQGGNYELSAASQPGRRLQWPDGGIKYSRRHSFLLSPHSLGFLCFLESLMSRHVVELSTSSRSRGMVPRCCPWKFTTFLENMVTLFRKEIPFPQFFPQKSHSTFASVSSWFLDGVWIPCMRGVCTAVQLRGGSAFLGFLEADDFKQCAFPPDAYPKPLSQNVLPINSLTAPFSVPSCLLQGLELQRSMKQKHFTSYLTPTPLSPNKTKLHTSRETLPKLEPVLGPWKVLGS